MSEPRTEAGREWLAREERWGLVRLEPDPLRTVEGQIAESCILAIEAEATQQVAEERDRLREALTTAINPHSRSCLIAFQPSPLGCSCSLRALVLAPGTGGQQG